MMLHRNSTSIQGCVKIKNKAHAIIRIRWRKVRDTQSLDGNLLVVCFLLRFLIMFLDYFHRFPHSYGQRENRREEVEAPLCRKEN